MPHDIIDNRREKLADNILAILPQAERARFAVGYLFLSGLEALGAGLERLGELRLLIGGTSTRETIELLAEGHRRLELVQERLEEARYAGRSALAQRAAETAANLRETLEVMDQTDPAERLIHSLLRMIEEGRLKVRVYTRGRLHAKAYIFDFARPNPGNAGMAVVGSSNLTLAGVRDNTELNVIVHDNASPLHPQDGNHGRLVAWFDELWDEAQDFEAPLMHELRRSWAVELAAPHDIYLKTLYALVQDRLEEDDRADILWDDDITRDLADFQKVAVRQAIHMIREQGGCFVADVVGLGKSYIGAGIVKHFERTERARPLIICPKPLEEMWVGYNETYRLNAHVVPMSMLQSSDERGVNLLEDVRYRDRDFVLVDESHNFRHHTSQRYDELQRFLSTGRRVCLLTATPRNSRAFDVYNQIKLFHPEERTALPIDPPDLKEYFNLVEKRERRLQDLLSHLLIRRTRRHILRWYGYAAESGRPLRELSDDACAPYLSGEKRAYVMVGGRHQYFPRRELETLRYSIEETYSGLYQKLRGYLGRSGAESAALRPGQELTYARYGLWRYVRPEKQKSAPYTDLQRAGINLRGLMRTSLFKRLESSVEAFRQSLERMIHTHQLFLKALEQGFVPAGEDAEALLGRHGSLDDEDLLESLAAVSGRYDIGDFEADRLRAHIGADIDLLKEMLALVAPITPEEDDKLQALLARLNQPPLAGSKCLIFTQYADTARYLFENLRAAYPGEAIEVIYGSDKSKSLVVGRFAPRANPEFRPARPEDEIRLLVATDVLAEGLNLQDCSIVLNYDLHWNPVRLIQRLGRIDRIGSDYDAIYALNFLPETGIERHLGLTAVLARRIREIHETIGEDAAILDRSERLNEQAMYAIYESQAGRLAELEGQEEDFMDLNEAEEFFRTLMKEKPEEFKRIQELRDGLRSTKKAASEELAGATYVFCQAGRYSQLFLASAEGEIISRDLPRVLEAIKAAPDTPTAGPLPREHNRRVMRVKKAFVEEVRHIEAQRRHTTRLTSSQRYVLRELRAIYDVADDEELRAQISELERAYRLTPTTPLNRELNTLRRNGVAGEELLKHLRDLYHQHRLRERLDRAGQPIPKTDIPRIIASESLL